VKIYNKTFSEDSLRTLSGWDGTPDPAQFCTYFPSLIHCDDFNGLTTGELDDETAYDSFYTNLSGAEVKGSLWKEDTGGYSNSTYADTGCLKYLLNSVDRNEYPMETMHPHPGLDSTEDVLYFGCMIYISADILSKISGPDGGLLGAGSKLMAFPALNGQEARPIVFMQTIPDTRDEHPNSVVTTNPTDTTPVYWIPMLSPTASQTNARDEENNFERSGAVGYYNGGDLHGFTFNDYVDQWIYVEMRVAKTVAANSNHELYIYTQDGVYQGAHFATYGADTPMIECASETISASHGNWDRPSFMYWIEYHRGATAETYTKLDNVRISTTFMGPPEGFVV